MPFRISGLLKQKKSNDKSISINFDRFPKNAKDITDLFLNFHSESQRQISFVGMELPTIEDLCKKGLLESLSFSYVSTQSTPHFTSYPKILDGKELYLYANVKDGVAPIPMEYYPKVTQLHMTCKDEIPISVNGTVYYNGFKKTITADTITFKIGSSVTIKFPNVDDLVADKDDLKVKLTIKLNGTLKQRIKALNFLIAMLDAKYFELGGVKFPANFPDTELKRLNVKNYPDILQTYNQIVGVLEKLHIKKDLPLDDFTKEDFWKLNTLVGAIESDKTVYNIKGDLPFIVNLNFGGLHLVMLCQKQDDGGYKLWDYFNKHIDVCCFGENNEKISVSQYSILKEDDFLTIDNLCLRNIIEDFKSIEPQQYIVENGNFVMLEMLKAYDKQPDAELLAAVKEMYAWLESVRYFLSDEVMLLNLLQIVRRERTFTFAEKQKLYAVIGTDADPNSKLGAFILLDEQDEAEKLLNEMPQAQMEEFMAYPIFKFYTKSKEDKDNG